MLPLYPLGPVDWLTTQSLYHTLPLLNEEGIVLCWPRTPYVSLGCHQDWADVNPECGLPIMRRRVGGSLVYLDAQQVFYQIVVSPSRLARLSHPTQWYRWALDPVAGLLRSWGLKAEHHAPADIWVGSRKISGNAGGTLDDRIVVVGNILLDFPVATMVRARYAPTPQFAQAFEDTLTRSVVTLKALRPALADPETVQTALARQFQARWHATVMPFPWARWDATLQKTGRELIDPGWLTQSGRPRPFYEVKVQEGRYLRAPKDPRFHHLTVEYETARGAITRIWGWPDDPLPLPLSREQLQMWPGVSPGIEWLRQLVDLPQRSPHSSTLFSH